MEECLLQLAITVERHPSGAFFWVVIEVDFHHNEVTRLFESAQSYAGYAAALEGGCTALLTLVPDMHAGPLVS